MKSFDSLVKSMEKQTIINTMRHAKTTDNDEKRYSGTRDIGLSETGFNDARLASILLKDFKFDLVITSSLIRAYKTGQLIAGDSVPIIKCPLCNERNFGIMEGLTWEDIFHLDPPVLMIKVGNDLHSVNPRGGEPFEDLWLRAKRFRQYLFGYHGGKNILVISHGVFLQMFHGVMRGLSCIESLLEYPSNLEFNQFTFLGSRLVIEKTIKLIEAEELNCDDRAHEMKF
jgi:broad specificity phosphatase PhoE